MFTAKAQCLPILLESYKPKVTAANRDIWSALPPELKEKIANRGRAQLNKEYAQLSMQLWLQFSKTGNRGNFADVYFPKRRQLSDVVMAECLERSFEYMDDILNGIYAITGEYAWWLPAHNTYERDAEQLKYPDTTRPVLELFSCETGALLAMTHYMLNDVLEQPVLTHIEKNISERIISPFLTEKFWWMGYSDQPMCNWTPWCTSNVLLCAFLLPFDNETRKKVLNKALYCLDSFIKEYEEDGCCDEGAQYYSHAALSLFDCLHILTHVAPNVFDDLYETNKIKNMANFIYNMHITDASYINFADCSSAAGRRSVREFIFACKTGNKSLQNFCAKDILIALGEKDDNSDIARINLSYLAFDAEHINDVLKHNATDIENQHKKLYYDSVGIFIAQDDTYTLAVKAGNNADSHNHNDVGSFILYKNNKPVFIDIGVETYSKKTFSKNRYDIWTMQSAWHNLPTIDSAMQKDGKSYKAANVKYAFGGDFSCIEMELQGAYPKISSMNYYKRKYHLEHGKFLSITDETDCKNSTVLSFITVEKPLLRGNTIHIGSAASLAISKCKSVKIQAVPIDDSRLLTSLPRTIYRTLIEFIDNIKLRID